MREGERKRERETEKERESAFKVFKVTHIRPLKLSGLNRRKGFLNVLLKKSPLHFLTHRKNNFLKSLEL